LAANPAQVTTVTAVMIQVRRARPETNPKAVNRCMAVAAFIKRRATR
jgi:hypothetical protein